MSANLSVSLIVIILWSMYSLLRFLSSITSLAIFVSCIAIPKSIAEFKPFSELTLNIFAIINPTVPATLYE